MKAITHVSINQCLTKIEETIGKINAELLGRTIPKTKEENISIDELMIIRDTLEKTISKVKRFNNHNVLSHHE